MRLINRLSKETGIPIPTIRYYENYGLIEGKRDVSVKTNNYSYYDDEVVEKLYLIRQAKQVGFTLSEIKKIIKAWQGNMLSANEKIRVFESKANEINERIQQLKNVKKMLGNIVKKIKSGNC